MFVLLGLFVLLWTFTAEVCYNISNQYLFRGADMKPLKSREHNAGFDADRQSAHYNSA